MSWTTITANISWQDIDVCAELATQYNYRARYRGLDDISAPTTADEVFDFIENMQTKIISTSFYYTAVDPSASFSGVAVTGSYPSNYGTQGLSQLYTDAGISSGFRRVAGTTPPTTWTSYNDAQYSYGTIQAGDMIGPWLFKDLQTLLDALYVFRLDSTDIVQLDYPYTSPSVYDKKYIDFDYETPDHTDTVNRVDDPADVPAYPPDTTIDYTVDNDNPVVDTASWSGQWLQWESGGTVYYWYRWDVYQPHYRLTIDPAAGARGNTIKTIDFYACVEASTPGGSFWDFPFGSKSTTSKIVATAYASTTTPWSGYVTNEASTASELLPARASHPDSDGGSAKLHNLVARVVLEAAYPA